MNGPLQKVFAEKARIFYNWEHLLWKKFNNVLKLKARDIDILHAPIGIKISLNMEGKNENVQTAQFRGGSGICPVRTVFYFFAKQGLYNF